MLGFDTGKLLIQPLKLLGELFVINAHAMKNRCVKVVDMNWIFGDVVTEIIGFTIRDSRLGTTTCHPHAEVFGMVISAVIFFGKSALRVDCSTKLAAPHHQRLVQEPPLGQVLHQRRGRLVGIFALVA